MSQTKQLEKRGITAHMVAKAYGISQNNNLTATEKNKIMKCLDVFDNYEDFLKNSSYAKSIKEGGDPEELTLISKEELLKSRTCIKINGYFTHFHWLDWDEVN